MSQRFSKAWLLSPAVLGASLILSSAALAENVSGIESEGTVENTIVESALVESQVPTVTFSEPLVQVPVNPQGGSLGPQQVDQIQVAPQPSVADIQAPLESTSSVNEGTEGQFNDYIREGRGRSAKKQSQVTSVSQLSDVQPTDWAFQALQSLVERYGCIAGYPDGTFKGNRALTRFEFAAGVNACLERINELIDAATSDLVTREDLAKLQRLMEEFAAELASLRGRVTVLEARTAELEANQFSTTTKLTGEVIFFLADTFGDRATYNVNGDQGPDGTG
ncbi:MAG: iron uptake porin, partial [Microcoleaceae cyanobacterium]